MTLPETFEPPTISNSDLAQVAALMKLDLSTLFTGARLEVATTNNKSLDITACPGSGKTTLLVAKLALLVRDWKYFTRGICVLSHTNVARQEIETCLGSTSYGSSLLSYPHYVGTIHSFVNEFVALPWLRSQGYPIRLIDTELALDRRWAALGRISPNSRRALDLNGYDKHVLTVRSSDFGVGGIRWGKRAQLGFETQTYKDIKQICRLSTSRGFFCYDEMFMWANALLDKAPEVAMALRHRFPMLFIDEAQDNSEEQGAILNRIFVQGGNSVICQRFGDDNQAIFDSLQAHGAETNPFPNTNQTTELADSHRFGQAIANIAGPLAAAPLKDGLRGVGPKRGLESGAAAGPHTIFLINEHCTTNVLEAYADLLLRTFSDEELTHGSYCAVAQIHRPPETEDTRKHPHHLCHYWPQYNPAFSKSEPTPSSFNQYVSLAQAKARLRGESHVAVAKIAEALLRLASEGKKELSLRKNRHRQVLGLLENGVDILRKYQDMLLTLAIEMEPLTEESWSQKWKPIAFEIATTISGSSPDGPGVEAFMKWNLGEVGPLPPITSEPISYDNVYKYPNNNPRVSIQLGSIHSVKGQTHTATLICETFWKRHNLETLIPWLLGEKIGCKKADGVDQLKRMKLHYVGLTRPTHLLCLAVKRRTLEDSNGNLHSDRVRALKQRGWKIDDLTLQLPLFPA